MNKSEIGWLCGIILAALLIIGGIILCMKADYEASKELHKTIISSCIIEGRLANNAGIEASANPYQGMNGKSEESKAWLDGYIKSRMVNRSE